MNPLGIMQLRFRNRTSSWGGFGFSRPNRGRGLGEGLRGGRGKVACGGGGGGAVLACEVGGGNGCGEQRTEEAEEEKDAHKGLKGRKMKKEI